MGTAILHTGNLAGTSFNPLGVGRGCIHIYIHLPTWHGCTNFAFRYSIKSPMPHHDPHVLNIDSTVKLKCEC